MTSIDEDILLSADGDDFDQITTFDEEALLGGGKSTEDKVEQNFDDLLQSSTTSPVKQEEEEEEEETAIFGEELDYDDDDEEHEDKRQRINRFASEKRKEDEHLSEEPEDIKPGDEKPPKIPSLFEKEVECPFKEHKQIVIKLRFEGETQEHTFYPKYPAIQPQIVPPRLPNGISLIPGMGGPPGPNHGSAGFGPTYLEKMEMFQQQKRAPGGMGIVPIIAGQWDQAVENFLRGGIKKSSRNSKRRRDRSSSEESYSSYDSSSSRSSRSRSRSRSYSPKRRRRESEKYRRRERKDRETRRGGDRDSRRKYEDKKRREEKQKHATIESAQALGLSNDYLDKVKEQKRQRDEIVRRKEERRHGIEEKEIKKTSSPAPVPNSDRDKKMKAYLVVNISGLKQLPTGVKKIEQLATELGPIRKCWKSSDDTVSVVFNAHDKAKDFMIKYNNKVITGLRVGVSLEKQWLNMSEMP
ncbi:unnamed protein product [Caenorhabditis angaria]|uniref:Uncharacterized protein n=1 Tax=Caenorhabditis angaria TaxID=860376 RepID=A0A9P1IJK3_9PELO|nr:unnamed protein product [Caenorhabditis angaria]